MMVELTKTTEEPSVFPMQ